MKSLAELYKVLSIATKSKRGTWFINFSGHVNRMWIKYYPMGWKSEGYSQDIEQELDEEGIQALYWFVRTRLTDES